MPYYVIKEAGNVVASGWADAENFNAGIPVGFEWADAPPPILVRTLTKLEYMSLFTDSELEAIYTAAKTSVAVEVWLEKFKLAPEIDRDDPRTAAGLAALESAGLLAVGRGAGILA